MLTSTALRTNGQIEPRGVDETPEFSWNVISDATSVVLDRAVIRLVAEDGASVWESDETAVPGAPLLRYTGPQLPARTAFSWQVRTWDTSGEASAWSEPTTFETGLLGEGLVPARWIRLDEDYALGDVGPVQYFRHEFALDTAPVRARSFSTALGWYRLGVNGVDATVDGLFPGFTAFESRVEYQVRDITDMLNVGNNVVSLVLADGRFRGRIGALGQPAVYGNSTSVIARLEIDLADGSTVVIGTDRHWQGGHGDIVRSDPRAGETIDARLRTDWDRVGGAFDEERTVREVPESRELVGTRAAEFAAASHISEIDRRVTPSGALLIDFGQNFHGVASITARGPEGAQIVVRHSEVVTPEGEVDLEYLFGGMPVDMHLGPNTFILSGDDDVFEPHFSTQGFRYIAIEAPEGVEILSVEGVPIYAAVDYHGRFESSDALVNRFHDNVAWSMRGNFLDVPTDCPTRERSGWTGDAQVFAPTALLMADTGEYLRNWLADARLQQHSDGIIPDIVPVDADSWREGGARGEMAPGIELPPPGSAGWGDAIVLIPWAIYQATGSVAVLEENYSAMSHWIARYVSLGENGEDPGDKYFIDSGYHWGEWLEPAGEGDGTTDMMGLLGELLSRPRAWVATAYFEHSSRLLAEIARLIGEAQDVPRFAAYADGAREAWRRHYLKDDGLLEPDAQATYVRALAFDLLPENRRDVAIERLVQRIRDRDTHLGTGFLSTGLLLDVLSENGADDVALDLLLQDSAPSWIGQVKGGATTVWESWTGYDDDGRAMMSHNHYSLGASARWLYERLAGIRSDAPGWRTFTVDPLLNRRIDRVSASTVTPFGRVDVRWSLTDHGATATLSVPVGTQASLRLRGASTDDVAVNGIALDNTDLTVGESTDGVVVQIGSGEYDVSWTARDGAILA